VKTRQWLSGAAGLFVICLVAGCGDRESSSGASRSAGGAADMRTTVSPGARRVAVVSRTRSGEYVTIDGQRQGEGVFDRVSKPVFSPDGESIAFGAYLAGKWFVMKDGKRVGGTYDSGGEVTFGVDGSMLAFVAWSGGQAFVVKDGRRLGKAYDGVGSLVFSHDGRSLAHRAEARGKCFVMRDGKQVGGQYDEVRGPVFASQTARLVFAAREGEEWFLVRDGEVWSARYKLGPMGWIDHLAFSADGQSVAFVARRETVFLVVKDNVRIGGEYMAVTPPVFAPDRDVMVFAATSDGRGWFLMQDDVEQTVEPAPQEIRGVLPGPAPDSVACWVRQGSRWFVNKNGARVGGAYDLPVELARGAGGRLMVVGVTGGKIRRSEVAW
jgi:hypothetical protein